MVPIPEPPPWISTIWRERSPAVITRFDQTVHAASGSPAAWIRSTPAGTGRTWTAGTVTRCAYPPPTSRAHTLSPTCQPITPGPSAAITPEHSMPRIGDAPDGGGYRPAACNRSARLTPLAATSTSTSPGPATGSGTSAQPSVAGEPSCSTVTAHMVPEGRPEPTADGRPPVQVTCPGVADRRR